MNPKSAEQFATSKDILEKPSFNIETIQLGKRFNREWIFRNLDHKLSSGNTYAITGPNGSGKSTLLQVLSSIIPQSTGELKYTVDNSSIKIEEVYQHISFAAPYMDLIEEFTLEEMVEFHFKLRKLRDGLQMHDLISVMYLDDSRGKFISNFSSGMKQRLKLGLAFYTESAVLLLDEPATNLDANAFSWYRHELLKISPKRLVIIASNNAEEYPETSKIISILDHKR